MSKTAIVFKSKYGFTEKYAKWISEELGADLIDTTKATTEKLSAYDAIVFGGGIYAGGIAGISAFKKNFGALRGRKLAVFTVGLTSTEDLSYYKTVDDRNFTPEMQSAIKIFHLRGGMDYAKLGFFPRKIMGMMNKMLEGKKEKTADDEILLKAYGKSVDFCDKSAVAPIVEYLK